ncbi:hypothetical protein C8J56DRAFT_928905 [Mycena floridula]|nr:hypothetical protein C8J56DRAFT_928905 [Mycena floridula]
METSNTVQPFPELPFEIVCLIIETMLEMAPNRAKELVTLSRNLQPVAEKALYHCVILEQPDSVELFSHSLAGCRSAWVQTLCIISNVLFNVSDLHAILSACSNIQTMLIDGAIDEHLDQDSSLDALASSAPQPAQLKYDFSWTQRSDGSSRFGLPLFQNITHLELWDPEFTNFNGKQLHCLANLTHLSLMIDNGYPLSPHLEHLQPNLFLSDSIVVCIIFQYCQDMNRPENIQNACVRFTDPRVVFSFGRGGYRNLERYGNVLWRGISNDENFIRRWGVRREDEGEMNMWKEAESIVNSPGKPFGLYRTVDSNSPAL